MSVFRLVSAFRNCFTNKARIIGMLFGTNDASVVKFIAIGAGGLGFDC